MMDFTDMSIPVTRGELKEALGQVKLELRQDIQAAIAPLATKVELEMWGGALLARIQQGEQRFAERLQQSLQQTEQRFAERLQQTEQRLLVELARHTSAIQESMQAQITASAEPFVDLPGRVSRLETAVFGATPRPRRTRRRGH